MKEYVEGGGRFFVWYLGFVLYFEEGEFCKFVKGYFKFYLDKYKLVRYYFFNKVIFDSKEFDFEIMDEYYFVFCDKDNINIYFYFELEDGSLIVGWWYNFGKGKVVVFIFVYREDGFLDNNFQEFFKVVLIFFFKQDF